jgi:anti-sigma regulatory factor (Ser/Thr protein kinase)
MCLGTPGRRRLHAPGCGEPGCGGCAERGAPVSDRIEIICSRVCDGSGCAASPRYRPPAGWMTWWRSCAPPGPTSPWPSTPTRVPPPAPMRGPGVGLPGQHRLHGYRWACLYDQRAHTEETLQQVRQVHPRLLELGGSSPAPVNSTSNSTTGSTGAGRAPPATKSTGLVRLRRLLDRWAGGHGADGDDADGDDADDVMIAVGEAVTNALQHGAPPVRVQAFPDGGVARVRVHNPGSAAVFATAGYHRPNTASGGGIGPLRTGARTALMRLGVRGGPAR